MTHDDVSIKTLHSSPLSPESSSHFSPSPIPPAVLTTESACHFSASLGFLAWWSSKNVHIFHIRSKEKLLLAELTSSLLASLLTLVNLLLLNNEFNSSLTLVFLSLLNGLLPRSDWDLMSNTGGGEVTTASFCLNARDFENIVKP